MNIDYETINLNEDEDFEDDDHDNDENVPELEYESDNVDNSIAELQNYTEINDGLKTYLQNLEDKLQAGKLDDYTFVLENLLIKYKQALIHRRFNISDEIDKQKIERIRHFKKILEEELINTTIDEFEFNRKYYNLLKLEYDLLLKYEDYSLKGKKVKDQVPKSFEEGISNLVKAEQSYFKRIAKLRNIDWPEKPKVTKDDSNKIKLQKLMQYYLEIERATVIVKNFIPGYKLRTVQEVMPENDDPKFTIDYPNTLTIERLREEFLKEKKNQDLLLDPLQEITQQMLKKMSEESPRIPKLSYIERLRRNKIPVMKFREYPETYEKLQSILGEEAVHYKIKVNDLTKDFNKKFYDVSPDVELSNMPKQFNPVYSVKIKNTIHQTDLSDSLQESKKVIKESNKDIKPSTKGYSFLLKIKELPKTKTFSDYSDYLEKGSTISISLKPDYFKSKKVIPNVIDERFFNIIKPLSDELYNKLKSEQLPRNKTDLIEVYELHVPVPELGTRDKTVKLARRYERFEDYLGDLITILETNMQVLETNGSVRQADNLFVKIQKIKRYLETGEDPEFEISSNYTQEDFIKLQPKIKIQRDIGTNRLRNYIFNFYPENDELVEVLENDIFNFNHAEYIDNIDKVLFIFKEYESTLDDYINARSSFIELIGMELPLIRPEDDLPEFYSNPKATFQYLYSWMPNIELYIVHKEELSQVKDNIIEFKKLKPELSQLELDEIYFQMIEYKQWEKSKLMLHSINIPKYKNPLRIMLSYLKRERNKLSSRRIFRVTTIADRITVRQRLYRIFSQCNIQNFNDDNIRQLCEASENIIYSYSKKPVQYYDFVDLVERSYKTICELIDEPEKIIPMMTEFIIKEGDLNYINIERINTFLNTLDSQDYKLIIDSLRLMRNDELNAYQEALIETQNQYLSKNKQSLIKAINAVMEENKKQKRELMYSVAQNSYISPIITNIIPKISTGADSFYVPEYYVVGDNLYLYGGNFPDYKNLATGMINYTDDEIY